MKKLSVLFGITAAAALALGLTTTSAPVAHADVQAPVKLPGIFNGMGTFQDANGASLRFRLQSKCIPGANRASLALVTANPNLPTLSTGVDCAIASANEATVETTGTANGKQVDITFHMKKEGDVWYADFYAVDEDGTVHADIQHAPVQGSATIWL